MATPLLPAPELPRPVRMDGSRIPARRLSFQPFARKGRSSRSLWCRVKVADHNADQDG